MAKRGLTISGSRTPAKSKRQAGITPPMPPSIGKSMMQGSGRSTHGDPPKTVGQAMFQPGRKQHPDVGPGHTPSMRRSLHQ